MKSQVTPRLHLLLLLNFTIHYCLDDRNILDQYNNLAL